MIRLVLPELTGIVVNIASNLMYVTQWFSTIKVQLNWIKLFSRCRIVYCNSVQMDTCQP